MILVLDTNLWAITETRNNVTDGDEYSAEVLAIDSNVVVKDNVHNFTDTTQLVGNSHIVPNTRKLYHYSLTDVMI